MTTDEILALWRDCGHASNDSNAVKFARALTGKTLTEMAFDNVASLDAALERLMVLREEMTKEIPAAAQDDLGNQAAVEEPPCDCYVCNTHPDDLAVNRFATAMKDKMEASRAKGRGGWNAPEQCPVERLQALLIEHLAKGDPVDIGNFAMMLFNRGAPVVAMQVPQ
jgi:hypothetical protein